MTRMASTGWCRAWCCDATTSSSTSPGSLGTTGGRIPVVIDETGKIATEITIAEARQSVELDTGSTNVCVSQADLAALGGAHPDWSRREPQLGGQCGAAMPAIDVPDLVWGRVHLGPQTVYGRTSPSEKSGPLGSPALQSLRLQIDYPRNAVFLTRSADS